jgi:hypothetical protein
VVGKSFDVYLFLNQPICCWWVGDLRCIKQNKRGKKNKLIVNVVGVKMGFNMKEKCI